MSAVGGAREVPVPLGVRQATAEGESRASDDFRTAMGAMEVGEDAMEKGEGEEAEDNSVEA